MSAANPAQTMKKGGFNGVLPPSGETILGVDVSEKDGKSERTYDDSIGRYEEKGNLDGRYDE